MKVFGNPPYSALVPDGGSRRTKLRHPAAALLAALLFVLVFAAAPALAAGPSATIAAVGTPTFTTIHVEGEVVPAPQWGPGEGFFWTYEVSSDGGASWQPTTLTSGETHSTEPVAANGEVEGLTAGVTYQLRLYLTPYIGSGVVSAEPNPEFTTTAVPAPAASIDAVTGVGAVSAHLSGKVITNAAAGDPSASDVHWHFECTPECPGLEGEVPAAVAEESIEATAHGLRPGTEYQVTLIAKNGGEPVSAGPVSFTTETVPPPTVTIDPVTTSTDTTAELSGRIEPNPLATDPTASDVEWHFVCEPECPGLGGGTVQSDAEGNEQIVTAAATRLEPNTEYSVKLVAKNAGEPVEAGPVTFTTSRTAPVVQTLPAFAIGGGTEAIVGGSINPRNSDTSYWIEWGPTTGYGQKIPATPADAGSGNQLHYVAERLAGLSPSTVYHARLVAESSGGPAHGSDVSFETAAAGSAIEGSCANSQLREENGSTELPDCRAYEMVSPLEKNGADVGHVGTEALYVAAADGEALAFEAFVSLPGAQSSKVNNENLSTRGSGGWSTQAINPPAPENYYQLWARFQHFSPNLDHAVVYGPPRLPLAPGAVQAEPNLFLRDNDTGTFSTLSAPASGAPDQFRRMDYYGESSDSSHVVFEAEGSLTPDAPAPPEAAANLYERVGNRLRLVAVLPNGEPAPHGTSRETIATQGRAPINGVSEDGSIIAFETAEGQIYVRENGTRTVKVSGSERSVPDPAESAPVLYGSSADGSEVVFTSSQALTDDAEPGNTDVYRYDVKREELEDLTDNRRTEGSNEFSSVVGMSQDASYIYFRTVNVDTGQTRVYLFHDGEAHFIGTGEVSGGLSSHNPNPARVSPNGRYLAFASQSRITGYDNTDATTGDPDWEVYLYDADTGRLTCASCRPSGAAPTGPALMPEPPVTQVNDLSRTVLDDGTVFFESTDRVVPADTNGVDDIYETRNGQVHLISSGTSGDLSGFAGASLDGRDAFLFTRERLVPGDTDNNRDIYDARIGGGFPAPGETAGACTGEECQGQASPSPLAVSPASAGLSHSPSAIHRHHRKKHKKRKKHPEHRSCRAGRKGTASHKQAPKRCKGQTTKTSKGGNR